MELTKLNPWNWFKNEEQSEPKRYPVSRAGQQYAPLTQLHREIDRIFDNAFSGLSLAPFGFDNALSGTHQDILLKPNVDIEASDKEYTVTVEIPGVEEDNITLELAGNTLTIKGEKKQESEKKEKDMYRVERAYGSFQRVLSLPEDAQRDSIHAQFKNGVLTITLPRTQVATKPKSKVIEIKSAT